MRPSEWTITGGWRLLVNPGEPGVSAGTLSVVDSAGATAAVSPLSNVVVSTILPANNPRTQPRKPGPNANNRLNLAIRSFKAAQALLTILQTTPPVKETAATSLDSFNACKAARIGEVWLWL